MNTCSQQLVPIKLEPYQEDHIKRMHKILYKCPVALDISKMGSGKTYTTSALSVIYKLPLLIIAARTGFKVWNDIRDDHPIQVVDMISYDILRGQTGKECNHPYLIRTADDQFLPTEYLKKLLRSGIMIVFDEMSKLKNQKSGVKAAAHALIKTLLDLKTSSRVLLLSALPCDKAEHILSLMQMLGIIYSDKIYRYNKSGRKYELDGLREAIDWCRLRDEKSTEQVISAYPEINKKVIPRIAINLYREVVGSRLSSCMKLPFDLECQTIIKNGYYKMISEDTQLLDLGQRTLRNAVRYYGNQIVNERSTNWGEVTKALQILGVAKLRTMVSLAYHDLMENSQRKLVLCAWYVDQLKWLTKVFEPFGAKLLYGPAGTKDRDKMVNLFQEPNSKCRVIVINPTVGGMAISLDDRDGDWPRSMYFIPDYRFIELVQTTGRILRQSTKSISDTIIRFIYSQQFKGESKILSALLRKSDDARAVISHNSGLLLPDDYQVDDNLSDLKHIPCPPLPIKANIRKELSIQIEPIFLKSQISLSPRPCRNDDIQDFIVLDGQIISSIEHQDTVQDRSFSSCLVP